MSKNRIDSTDGNYFSGGLAELVSRPSELTQSFLAGWFTGAGSLGTAMKLLGMPYCKTTTEVLEVKHGELLVNLTREEETLYKDTIFMYKKQTDIHDTPKLTVDAMKCFNPVALGNTAKVVWIQSKWISSSAKVSELAKRFVSGIPDTPIGGTVEHTDVVLKNTVWPYVLAVGMLCEFYNQYITQTFKAESIHVNEYIGHSLTAEDWFFHSIADQEKVQKNNMSFAEYMKKYGIRADSDYELACPRWQEIPAEIRRRIAEYSPRRTHPVNDLTVTSAQRVLIDTAVSLQLLRTEAKKKLLIHLNHLRKIILRTAKGDADIRQITKDQLVSGIYKKQKMQPASRVPTDIPTAHSVSSGIGICISPGIAEGAVMHILRTGMRIPEGTIGVFPNASPEFSIEYPKCAGMIFLRGGMTSHGAIVAREFGIPAIVDADARYIPDTAHMRLNASTGEWHIG